MGQTRDIDGSAHAVTRTSLAELEGIMWSGSLADQRILYPFPPFRLRRSVALVGDRWLGRHVLGSLEPLR